jgi:hypothetical protein
VVDKFAAKLEKDRAEAVAGGSASASIAPDAAPAEAEAEAERLKSEANERLRDGSVDEAIALYTAAITAAPTGSQAHVLFANRAAALSRQDKHSDALADALYVPSHTNTRSHKVLSLRWLDAGHSRARGDWVTVWGWGRGASL